MKEITSTAIRFDGTKLFALDQRHLPEKEIWIDITHPDDTISAIQTLAVRGAPLIGVTAAMCLGIYSKSGGTDFEETAKRIRCSRPTAVNLAWAIDRLLKTQRQNVLGEAVRIWEEDIILCSRISAFGAQLIPSGATVLTHCNAGALATAGVGTAVGIIREAHRLGKKIQVYVDETRPLLQGARLTAWELKKAGVPYILICDNMAASLMKQKKIQLVIVGADRISASGDFANKIGTYSLAVNCHYHGIPLIVAAPFSTIDWNCASGAEIPIELRDPAEVRVGENCWNPAFDVTDHHLVSHFVLDTGVYSLETFVKLNHRNTDRLAENLHISR